MEIMKGYYIDDAGILGPEDTLIVQRDTAGRLVDDDGGVISARQYDRNTTDAVITSTRGAWKFLASGETCARVGP
jgi:hypothetical protein